MQRQDSQLEIYFNNMRLVMYYLVFSVIWILSSDLILKFFFKNPDILIQLEIIKGWIFVILSSSFFYFSLIRRTTVADKRKDKLDELKRQLNLITDGLNPLFEQLPMAIWMINDKGEFLFSGGISFGTDFPINTLDGKNVTEIDNPVFSKMGEKLQTHEADSWIFTFGDKTLEIHFTPYQISNSYFGIGFAIDITERVHYIEELENAKEMIFKTQKISTLGEISLKFLHDLRNYLNIMQIWTEYAKMKIDDRELNEHLVQISNVSEHIKSISDQLFRYGAEDKEIRPFTITEYLQGQKKLFEGVIPSSINFHIQNETPDKKLNIPETKLTQVLMNLMLNAVDAIKEKGSDGEIKLLIESMSSTNREMISISVIDSGLGIPQKDQNQIFDNFYTTKTNGSGLGLTIVKEIVNNWDGEISVHSSDGSTKFRFTVPLYG